MVEVTMTARQHQFLKVLESEGYKPGDRITRQQLLEVAAKQGRIYAPRMYSHDPRVRTEERGVYVVPAAAADSAEPSKPRSDNPDVKPEKTPKPKKGKGKTKNAKAPAPEKEPEQATPEAFDESALMEELEELTV